MRALQPTLCARCAAQGKTCCQGREIYLTPGDVRRIAAFTGENQFVEWHQTADPSYLDQDDDPIWRQHVFRSDGSRRILRRTPNGDCLFLGPQGCRLPLAVRPLLCRLHPLTYTADNIDAEADPACPLPSAGFRGDRAFGHRHAHGPGAALAPAALRGDYHRCA